jgi:hypothetical protein
MNSGHDQVIIFGLSPLKAAQETWQNVVRSVLEASSALEIGLVSFQPESGDERTSDKYIKFVDYLDGWPKINCSKSIVALEKFRAFSSTNDYQRFRFIAIKLLNRRDFTGTFRFLEREVIFENAVALAFTLILQRKPNIVVFDVTPHEFLPYVYQNVAEWLGVRTLHFQPSSLSATMLAKTGPSTTITPPRAVVRTSTISVPLLSMVSERLDVLVKGIDPAYMKSQRDGDRAAASPLRRIQSLGAVAGWLFADRFPTSIDFSGHGRRHDFITRAMKVALGWSLQTTLRRKIGTLGSGFGSREPYAVFAMHYEPERTSIPDGYPIDSQGAGIAHARALIPSDLRLIVKEHYSQQTLGKRGFLGRSPLFYEFVRSFPNTSFAPTDSRLTELLSGATSVFTLTGTIAIEAVLRGIPVAYFGSPWWEGLPGAIKISEGVDYEMITTTQVPTPERVREFIENLTAEKMVPGLAGEKVLTLESRLGPLPDGFFEAESHSISQCILELLGSG